MRTRSSLYVAGAIAAGAMLASPRPAPGQALSGPDLAQEIFDTMLKLPRADPAHRPVHAKGVVCRGTFAA